MQSAFQQNMRRHIVPNESRLVTSVRWAAAPRIRRGGRSAACSSAAADGVAAEAGHPSSNNNNKPPPAAGRRGLAGAVRSLVQKHGAGAAFAYLTVSNVASVGTLAAAWLLFARATGASPLAAGAWPKFAAAFAPAYLAVQASRGARLAAGVALAPAGEWVLARVRRALRLRGRGAALAAALVMEAVLLLAALGLVAAVTAGGGGAGPG